MLVDNFNDSAIQELITIRQQHTCSRLVYSMTHGCNPECQMMANKYYLANVERSGVTFDICINQSVKETNYQESVSP